MTNDTVLVARDREEQPVDASAAQDMTESKSRESQDPQAQKMEAIGQLAGVVAHDFNNLLTIICGYSDILIRMSHSDDPRMKPIEEIRKAGDRAKSLTHQLLAFSRKQVLEPRVLDLNMVVKNVETMLQRLIGEDIRLTAALDPTISLVKVDPGQLEQIIINLAVNARDAMPQGGSLTVETCNAEVNEAYCREHPGCQPGHYVMLSMTDTGCGMTPEVQAHIFEPFFTTKERGKGTGLGLATVYGIVKQSNGYIAVYSEPEQGTSVKVYLPQVREPLPTERPFREVGLIPHGNETVLLVEDDRAILAFAQEILESCGYSVITAADGREAVRLADAYREPIHLLVSDVVMPHMSGRLVAEQVATLKPGIGVLFISGYADDAVFRHGIVQSETHFLQKPFLPHQLAQKVREVLDDGRDPFGGAPANQSLQLALGDLVD